MLYMFFSDWIFFLRVATVCWLSVSFFFPSFHRDKKVTRLVEKSVRKIPFLWEENWKRSHKAVHQDPMHRGACA